MKIYITLLLLTISVFPVVGQRIFRSKKPIQLEVDLSYGANSKREIIVPLGEYQIIIKNQLPKESYTVAVVKESMLPEPLELPSKTVPQTSQNQLKGGDPCEKIATLMKSINEATTEIQISSYANQLKLELVRMEASRVKYNKLTQQEKAKIDTDNTEPCEELTIEKANELLDALRTEVENIYELKVDQKITVTITKNDSDGVKTKWEVVYVTERKREAVITYGWLASSAKWPYEEERYFLATVLQETPVDPDSQPITQKYKVTKSNSSKEWYPAASVLFSYRPTAYKGASFRPVFGIGTDASSINFLFGGQLLIANNYAVNSGFIFNNRKMLNGKYKEGDEVTETLSDDQLHEDKFVPSFFIGISLRFAENPRGQSSSNP
jgi:hypothetical protein